MSITTPVKSHDSHTPLTPSTGIARAEAQVAQWLAAHSITLLRISLGLVFLGFGVLKFFPGASPAEALVIRTVDALTLGLVSGTPALVMTAAMETFIGLTLITGRGLRAGLVVLAGAMVGIMSPLVLFYSDLFPGGLPDHRGPVRAQGHRPRRRGSRGRGPGAGCAVRRQRRGRQGLTRPHVERPPQTNCGGRSAVSSPRPLRRAPTQVARLPPIAQGRQTHGNAPLPTGTERGTPAFIVTHRPALAGVHPIASSVSVRARRRDHRQGCNRGENHGRGLGPRARGDEPLKLIVKRTPSAELVRRAFCCPRRFGSPNPPGGLLPGSLDPTQGGDMAHLGDRLRPTWGRDEGAPAPSRGINGRDHHQGRSTEWGLASAGSGDDTKRPPQSSCGGRPDGRRKNSGPPNPPCRPCRLPQAADDSSNSSVAPCQKGLPNVSIHALAPRPPNGAGYLAYPNLVTERVRFERRG